MAMDEFDDILVHYGTPRHSGRYPWGSGENPYQRSRDFMTMYKELKAKGLSESDVAQGLGLKNTTELRAQRKLADNDIKNHQLNMIHKLKEKGMSNVAIAERLDIGESQVRSLLAQESKGKRDRLNDTAEALKEALKQNKYVDVGAGVARYMGVSDQTLAAAVKMLEKEGYELKRFDIRQVTTGNITPGKAIVPAGTTNKELYSNLEDVGMPGGYISATDGNLHYIHRPVQIDPSRVMVRYATDDENSGQLKDGTIELRRGVQDLDMGNSKYAQVRIAMNNGLYMKGMALYNDHMPDGVDIIFNSNKKEGTPLEKVFKEQKSDPDNPFGSAVKRQNDYIDDDGVEHQGALNILKEEGAWQAYSKSIASQVLSKQPRETAAKQLSLAASEQKEAFEEIMSLTNPVIKKKLLEEFADNADKAAVDLKAAAFPRQNSRVILPINSLKDNEVFAPTYQDGEEVILIRYPHGGIFEIPRLKVNNKNKEAREVIGTDAVDAVGINSHVAEQLSGADFDGDHVVVIPTRNQNLKNMAPLEQLKDFDPKAQYAYHEGMKPMTERQKGMEMGIVTNLITDMTLQEAPFDEIARAVRHSMVVIDAYKHKLDFRQSAIDNNIAELKRKYQTGGASTLVSRAKSPVQVDERARPHGKAYEIDPETGKKIFSYTGATKSKPVKDDTGKIIDWIDTGEKKTQDSYKMYEHEDARDLSSGHPMDELYATYANTMKALGNQARKASLSVGEYTYSPTAHKAYAAEVQSLNDKLDKALRNAPKERKAQMVAYSEIKTKIQAHPELNDDLDELKKIRQQTLNNARIRFGASRENVVVTEKEWEAIQAGAISKNKLQQIIDNADTDAIKKLATPRAQSSMTPAKIASARAMLNAGYTIAEVAERYGVSTSTITNYVKGSE